MLTIINNNKNKGKTLFINLFFKIQRKTSMCYILNREKHQFNNGGPASIGRLSKGGSVYTDFMVGRSLRQK